MPPLYWILALTLLHSLSAAPTASWKKETTFKEILRQIRNLQNVTCETDDSEFYINSDVTDECIKTALSCATSELLVVAEECFIDGENAKRQKQSIKRTREQLENVLKDTIQTAATPEKCKNCEENQTKPYKEFLRDLETLVQKFNTNF